MNWQGRGRAAAEGSDGGCPMPMQTGFAFTAVLDARRRVAKCKEKQRPDLKFITFGRRPSAAGRLPKANGGPCTASNWGGRDKKCQGADKKRRVILRLSFLEFFRPPTELGSRRKRDRGKSACADAFEYDVRCNFRD